MRTQRFYVAPKKKSTVLSEKDEVEEKGVKEDAGEVGGEAEKSIKQGGNEEAEEDKDDVGNKSEISLKRFVAVETQKPSSSKTLSIEKKYEWASMICSSSRYSATEKKLNDTQVKDIPNAASKLAKRVADDNLQLLHMILFGKKAKVHKNKKNIGLLVGDENEAKKRAKLEGKIGKCIEEKLLHVFDILDIPVNRFLKEEELCDKLCDFFESQRGTLMGKKRKSKASTGTSPTSSTGKSKTKQKLDDGSGKKPKYSKEEDSKSGEETHYDDDDITVLEEESEQEEPHSEDGSDGDEEETHDDDDDITVPEAESEQEEPHSEDGSGGDEDETEKPMAVEGSSSILMEIMSSKSSENKTGKQEVAEKHPNREEMKSVVEDILMKVDLDTTTISDVQRLLEDHFGEDMVNRGAEIKAILTEIINSASSEDDDGEDTESDDDDGEDTGSDDDDIDIEETESDDE